jgi:hypothetical protein
VGEERVLFFCFRVYSSFYSFRRGETCAAYNFSFIHSFIHLNMNVEYTILV